MNQETIPFSPTMEISRDDETFREFLTFLLSVIQCPFDHHIDGVLTYTDNITVNRGILWIDPSTILSLWYDDLWNVTIVSLEQQQVIFHFTFNAVSEDIISVSPSSDIEYGTIDLSTAGNRWNGSILNGAPHGFGTLYDERGHIVFEGFYVDGRPECYGISYHNVSHFIEYKGNYCHGERHGIGCCGDMKGVLYSETIFLMNQPYCTSLSANSTSDLANLHIWLEELVIDNIGEWHYTYFPFNQLRNLRILEIKRGCFRDLNQLFLTDMMNLQKVTFGYQACSRYNNAWSEEIDHDSEFRLCNCPKLTSVFFGNHSLSDFYIFTIENLPSLKSLKFGEFNEHSDSFTNCPTMIIDGFPELEELVFGGQAFFGVKDAQIKSKL